MGSSLPGPGRQVRAVAAGTRAERRPQAAVVQDASVPLHRLGPALWNAVSVEGTAETVVPDRCSAFGRRDHYPVELVEHLIARRGQTGQQPSTVALLTLVGRYVDSRRGRRGQSIAVHRTRTSRAAYDRALEDVDVPVMPTTPQTARPLPDRAAGPGASIRAAIEMSADTTPFDISHHPATCVP